MEDTHLKGMDQEDVIKIFRDLPAVTQMKIRRATVLPDEIRAEQNAEAPMDSTLQHGTERSPKSSAGHEEMKGSETEKDATPQGKRGGKNTLPEGFTEMTVTLEKPPRASLGLSLVPSFGKLKGFFQVLV